MQLTVMEITVEKNYHSNILPIDDDTMLRALVKTLEAACVESVFAKLVVKYKNSKAVIEI